MPISSSGRHLLSSPKPLAKLHSSYFLPSLLPKSMTMRGKKPTSTCREVISWVIQRWDRWSFAKFLLMLLKRRDNWNQFWTSWWLFSSGTHSLVRMLKGSAGTESTCNATWVHSLGREDPLEDGMATHSITLAWRSHGQRSPVGYSPFGREETDTTKQLNTARHKGSQSRHWGFRWFLEDSWASKSGFRWLSGKRITCQCRRLRRCRLDPWVWNIPWRRKSQSYPVSLPGKFHEQRSLEGYSPWGCKESDLTEPALTASKTPVGMGEEVKRKAEKVRKNVSNWTGHCWLISPHLGSEGRKGNFDLCASFFWPWCFDTW